MIVSGYSVANAILKRVENKVLITPIKLHSLIYLVYANYLYLTGEKLFNEIFTVENNIPIIPSVLYKFYSCNKYIRGFALDALDHLYMVKGDVFDTCLDNICRKYILYSDKELIDIINLEDTFRLSDEDILLNESNRNGKTLRKAKD